MTGTRVPALDGLRGIAISLVLLFHWQLLSSGLIGVDVFFVLSGFLITGLLVDEHRIRGRVDYRRFYRRRVRRLAPPLLATVLLVMVFGIHLAGESRPVVVVLAVVFYLGNFSKVFILGSLANCWSLAVEEQFYMVWPWLTRHLLRPKAPAVLITLAGLIMTARYVLYLLRPGIPVWPGQATPLRVDGLLLGAAVALLIRRGMKVSPVTGFAGAALIVGAVWGTRGPVVLAFAYGYTLAVLGTAVLLASLASGNAPLSRVLSWRPLAGLGRVSYGVYLFHWPVLCLFGAVNPGRQEIILDVLVTALLTAASWRWLERPGSLRWMSRAKVLREEVQRPGRVVVQGDVRGGGLLVPQPQGQHAGS